MQEKLITYLALKTSLPVYAEKPESPDASYIVVDLTSTAENNRTMRSTYAIMCYADTLANAAALADTVIAELEDFGAASGESAELENAYNSTNPRTRDYRYTVVENIYYVRV